MSELYYSKYNKIIKNSNSYNTKEINNTITQCYHFLLIIYDYVKKCFDILIKLSVPTLDKYTYKSLCDEVRMYVREIDNIVQSAQYNTRQILISSKNTESSKEIIFNIMPFGYSFTFEVPVIDTVALGLEDFKIDWKYKHACITALAATEPKNISRTEKSVKLLNTYDLERKFINNSDMRVYSNYGIDKNNITKATVRINKNFEFDDYNSINLYTIPRNPDSAKNEFIVYDKNSNNYDTYENFLNYYKDYSNEPILYSQFLLDKNPLYLTYISVDSNAQLDFSSTDLLETSLKFPFELKDLEIDTVDEIEKYLSQNLHKFKTKFCKALKLVELEIEKMIHYKNILIPTQSRILGIHNTGFKTFKKNKNKKHKCNSDLINVNRVNLKRKILSKKKYEDRTILEFTPGFISIYEPSKGDKSHTIVNSFIKYELEQADTSNRRDTYNIDNFFKIFNVNGTDFSNISYDDRDSTNIKITQEL